MARRRKGGLDLIAALPWPMGVAAGLVGYWVIRYGVGIYLSSVGGQMLQGLAHGLSAGAFVPMAWLWLGACWLAAFVSFRRRMTRQRLLATQRNLDDLRALSWQQFEQLVGEAYRRQGYAVEETGQGGADGGIDLILRRSGRTELVQCKQWRNRQVSVAVVREMWGLLAHHSADAIKIVCIGAFTKDATTFAAGKAIELIHGEHLLELVTASQRKASEQPATSATPDLAPASMPSCPSCGQPMVARKNKNTGQAFLGCVSFPSCRGTRPA
ncbi:MAG: restriction endonuclease [Xanthomonadaceae bacterium]|nr:restriction endonuclease [Xanthomonadaceae bacterium]MDP2185388.1 restriction endonuclease [Xanthomonadales bacterium]MDZ4115168.1 restriction endonuclease [Xanthomonadaceae bacterium]MDZ4377849.1 restriction endonuclease [Xanthomonadaceae bacterium]